MKKNRFKLLAFVLCVFLGGFSASAQVNSDEILSNSEEYSKWMRTIELAQMDRELSTFTNLVALAGLGQSLFLAEDHTVFVPTNEAFKKMPLEQFLHLTNPKNRTDLVRFLKYHFLPTKVMSYDFKESQVIDTSERDEITVTKDNAMVYIGGATIIKPDIQASNGVIHVVNRIVEPNEDVLFGK